MPLEADKTEGSNRQRKGGLRPPNKEAVRSTIPCRIPSPQGTEASVLFGTRHSNLGFGLITPYRGCVFGGIGTCTSKLPYMYQETPVRMLGIAPTDVMALGGVR